MHDPETVETARRIFDMALAGETLSGIAHRLYAEGIPSPGGQAQWTPAGIRKLLLNPIYVGTYVAFRDKQERVSGGKYQKPAESSRGNRRH